MAALDAHGDPVIRKYSAHALGQYRSPITGDRKREWIEAAWRRKIRAAFGAPVQTFPWEEQPALAQLTLSTWSVMKPYAQNPNIRPFDFLLVAAPSRSICDLASGYRSCCADRRPSCFLFDNPAAWQSQEWRCLRCAQPFPSPRFRSYGSVTRGTLDSFEVKRLCANGDEPGPNTMRGLTIPRPVRVEWITAIGKEVIGDPTGFNGGDAQRNERRRVSRSRRAARRTTRSSPSSRNQSRRAKDGIEPAASSRIRESKNHAAGLNYRED
jgi:hypothetical protein